MIMQPFQTQVWADGIWEFEGKRLCTDSQSGVLINRENSDGAIDCRRHGRASSSKIRPTAVNQRDAAAFLRGCAAQAPFGQSDNGNVYARCRQLIGRRHRVAARPVACARSGSMAHPRRPAIGTP